MQIKSAIKIVNNEKSSAEDIAAARKFLISEGTMRIKDGAYEVQAKHDPFMSQIKNGEDWIFYGLVSPYDGLKNL